MIKIHPNLNFKINSDELALWHIDSSLLKGFDSGNHILDADECARGARFVFEKHRVNFYAARKALRLILAKYIDIPPTDIEFSYGRYGKPNIDDCDFKFNFSHSGTKCLLGVSASEVGVDIEVACERDYQGIAHHSFSELECQQLMALPEAARRDGFYRIWTQKEAFIKLKGLGLHYPLKAFSVSANEGGSLLSVDDEKASNYAMQSLKLNQATFVALCAMSPLKRVQHYLFTLEDFDDET